VEKILRFDRELTTEAFALVLVTVVVAKTNLLNSFSPLTSILVPRQPH